MGKTKNSSANKSSKWVALVTYVIALLCLLAGLLIPLGKTEGFTLENMLAYQLPGALFSLAGVDLGFGAPFTYGSQINLFGLVTFDLGAALVLIFALVAVAGLVGLIPVIASNRRSKTALKTASVIECLALIPLTILLLLDMRDYSLLSIAGMTGTFSYAIIIAFGGTLLMLIVQAFAYRKGSGFIKFVLFLLSAIAVLTAVYPIATFIPQLGEVMDGKLATGLYGMGSEGIWSLTGLFATTEEYINALTSLEALPMVLEIATLIAAFFIVLNFMLDMLGLGKKTNRFMLVCNLIRYIIEVLAVALMFAMTFFVDGVETLQIIIIALAVIAIIQLVINIIRNVTYRKHPKKKAKAPVKEKAPVDYFEDENAEGESEGKDEKPLSKKEQKRLAKEEKKAEKEREEEEKRAAKEEKKAAKEEAKQTEAAPVAEPSYVLYNGPTDSFINKLTNSEKIEFFNVFLERNVVSLPNIPQYTVNGKNEKFFSAVFIYFGKIRDHVSDGLLNKLYQQMNML